MSATGSVPARGRRHTIRTKTEARRYAEAGWEPAWIARRLDVPIHTIVRWCDPEQERRYNARSARHHALRATERGAEPMGYGHARPEYKLARMGSLRDVANLSCSAIARVMFFDFGDPLTEHQVRYALEVTGVYPKIAKAAA